MNFGDIQEAVFRFMGERDSSTRQDQIVQQVKDDINHTLDDIVNNSPYLWQHVRETTITLADGTSTYNLDDFCVKPLAFWTEDNTAHKIDFLDPREMDRNGSKNTNATFASTGPFSITWFPRTTSALKSGTDASISNAATQITTSGGLFAASDVGKRVRINGEPEDFTISTFTDTDTIDIDRTYRSKLSGTGTSGAGANLSSVKWEIEPPGIYRVQFRPTPNTAQTVHYRYVKSHSRMINDDDVPDLMEKFHHVILAGSIMRSANFEEDNASHQRYAREYSQGLLNLIQEDRIEVDTEPQMRYDSPFKRDDRRDPSPPGTTFRTGSTRII